MGGVPLKKTLLFAYAALLIAYLLPFALGEGPTALPGPEPQEIAPLQEPQPGPEQTEPPLPTAPPEPLPQTLRVLHEGQVRELSLQDYLVGVVAAEMPASFPAEALKAQAVAARTYAVYCAASRKHPEADVCTDPGCCQAWLDEADMRQNWGEAYGEKLAAVRTAVEDTAGESLRYGGEPVFAAFHSSSAGLTEDCGAVWSPQPYLISVDSPETAADVPGFISTLRCAPIDFRDVILSAYPQADFSGPEESWIGALRRDDSGRVAAAVLGGVEIPGKTLRSLFSLRSTAFTLDYTDGDFLFTVTGYGHGVGMSQYGAMVMARDGADYRQILSHYYPGTDLAES